MKSETLYAFCYKVVKYVEYELLPNFESQVYFQLAAYFLAGYQFYRQSIILSHFNLFFLLPKVYNMSKKVRNVTFSIFFSRNKVLTSLFSILAFLLSAMKGSSSSQ